MKTGKHRAIALLAALFLSAALQAAWAGPADAAAGPDPVKAFAEVLKPYSVIRDYTVRVEAKVRIPDFRVPDFAATVYFKRPDRFHLETKNFAPMPRGAALFDPFRFRPEKNRLSWLAAEPLEGEPADLFRVEPLDEKEKIRSYQVWIGGNPKRILQVESLSVQGVKARARIRYALVRQDNDALWLPERVAVKMTFPERGVRPQENLLYGPDSPVSRGMARLEDLPSEGAVEIAYAGWSWNRGLDDSLFRKK